MTLPRALALTLAWVWLFLACWFVISFWGPATYEPDPSPIVTVATAPDVVAVPYEEGKRNG